MGASLTGAGRRAALKALRIAAGSPGLDRLGLRAGAERLLTHVTREGVRAGRTFARVQRTGAATRQRPARTSGLFDLTPTDEQAMLVEALSAVAAGRRRPPAHHARGRAGSVGGAAGGVRGGPAAPRAPAGRGAVRGAGGAGCRGERDRRR